MTAEEMKEYEHKMAYDAWHNEVSAWIDRAHCEEEREFRFEIAVMEAEKLWEIEDETPVLRYQTYILRRFGDFTGDTMEDHLELYVRRKSLIQQVWALNQ